MEAKEYSVDLEAENEDSYEKAIMLFQKNGFVLLHNIFSKEYIESIKDYYYKNYSSFFLEPGQEDRRPLHTIDIKGAMNSPELYANKRVANVLKSLLGKKYIIGSLSSVLSFPGSPDQRIHRDSLPLYDEGFDYSLDVDKPPHSITALIPIIDITLENGCTRIWPGSHLLNTYNHLTDKTSETSSVTVDPEVPIGSVLLTDSRVVHHGAANKSNNHRPLIYITYYRHWFRDFWGYEHRPPVNISRKELSRVPEEYRSLFSWTKDPYFKWRLMSLIPNFMSYNYRQIKLWLKRS